MTLMILKTLLFFSFNSMELIPIIHRIVVQINENFGVALHELVSRKC